MPAANTYDNPGAQGGNRESIMEDLTILEPEGTPFVSLVKKTTATATLTEAVADTLRSARVLGTREGKPASGGSNKAGKRKRFGNYVHRIFDEFGTTDTQQAVSRRGGVAVTNDEYGDAKAKCLREIKRDLEAVCLSNQEMQGASDDEMITRGFFKWVQVAAQGTQPVPVDFRTPTASILTGVGTSVPLFTEAAFNTVLKSMKGVYGAKQEVSCIAGDDVIDTVDNFSRVQSNTTNQRYTVQEQASNRQITLMVTVFESSFARVNMISDQFVRFAATSTVGEANSAALVIPEYWEMQWLEDLISHDSDDEGGGPWGWIRGHFANMCRNPKGQGAIYNS